MAKDTKYKCAKCKGDVTKEIKEAAAQGPGEFATTCPHCGAELGGKQT